MSTPKATDLSEFLKSPQSVLVTGGTGFIGTGLVQALVKNGHRVTVLTRSAANAAHLATPVQIVTSLDQIEASQKIDAIVDLAGEPVAGGLWTRWRRFYVVASRRRTLNAIEALIRRLEQKPSVLIKASAVGIYGVRDDEPLSESAELGGEMLFSMRSCRTCERALVRTSQRTGIRTVALRIGLVLGRDGGLLARFLPPFDLGLGGRIGSGQQWMSWISLEDMVRMIAFAIVTPQISGPLNGVAPQPVRNAEFAASLARALHRPAVIPVPALVLQTALGNFAREIILGGQRVVPEKATAAGFTFRHETLADALGAALVKPKNKRPSSPVRPVLPEANPSPAT